MDYLGATLTQVFARARGGADASLRDVTIAHIGSGVTECGWRHAPEERGGFGEILKKSVSRVEIKPVSGEDGWFFARSLAETFVAGATRAGRGDRWKSQNRKIVPLSPYVEEPLNSKVIKSFVPEQRSRKCFFVFRDSYILCYIYMNIICPFRIFMYMAMVQLEPHHYMQFHTQNTLFFAGVTF